MQAHLKNPKHGVVISVDSHRVLPSAGGKAKQSPGVDDYRFEVRWLDGDTTEEPAEYIGTTGVYRKYCLQHGLPMMEVDSDYEYSDEEIQP